MFESPHAVLFILDSFVTTRVVKILSSRLIQIVITVNHFRKLFLVHVSPEIIIFKTIYK